LENNAQLLKGVLEYCVLRLIEKEPTYGYEIVMQLKQVGFAEISESTLYPLLLRLEQQEKPKVLCDHRKGDGFSFGFSTGMEPTVRFGRKDFSGG
jgi:hypothetical protein